MITQKELIKKYIEFFRSKNHKEIPNASLIPENDPTVLFTTAGMHPLVPFLLGQKHPQGKKLVNVQRCIRTQDIDEVGDTTHHTFFEMLGNWSIGDYFKKEAIEMSFEFLTKVLKIQKEKLAVSVFAGDKDAQKDNESAKIWESLGISKQRIAFLPKSDNWWGPAGKTGPCGPDTEMFYWKDNSKSAPKKFNPNDDNWVEIWNDVLMQYNKNSEGKYEEAKQKNIDTGMGVERTLAVLNNLEDNYESEVWKPIIKEIEKLSGKKYDRAPLRNSSSRVGGGSGSQWGESSRGSKESITKSMRIIADHIKAAVFILAEGITPSNTEQGYVLRRLIRRAILYGKKLKIPKEKDITTPLTKAIIKIYSDYPELKKRQEFIIDELNKEEDKFEKTLEKGLRIFEKMIGQQKDFARLTSANAEGVCGREGSGSERNPKKLNKKINCKDAFLLYQSYGFPIEMTIELAKEKGIQVDEKGFEKECELHSELSRTASAGKFKSGLADNSEATTKLHTATHLLLRALQIVLDDDKIIQRGSNITAERLRFDFSFPRKLEKEELQKVEDLVNAQIQNSCEVMREEMSPAEAKKKGACGIFDKKYSDKVSVYTIGNFSKEICTGPHVKNTCELGRFKIQKEESSSSGVRRIKAVLN